MDTSGHDAIALLPEEVWKYILDFAVTSNDKILHNCILTCSLWKQLLRQHNFRSKLHLVLPDLYRYLSGNDILKCRSICKKWCSAINKYSPDGEPKISMSIDRVGAPNNLRIYHVFRNVYPHFHRHLEAIRAPIQERTLRRHRIRKLSHCNTKNFIFRSINFTIGPNVNVYRNVMPYLSKINIYVRALHIKFPIQPMQQTFYVLYEVLLKVPSLEYLKVSAFEAEPTDGITQVDLIGLKLPALNKLKVLNVTELPNLLQEFFLRRYKSQLAASNREADNTCQVMNIKDQFMWKGPINLLQARIENRSLTHAHFSLSSENCQTKCKFTHVIKNFEQTLQILSIMLSSEKQQDASSSGNVSLAVPSVNLASSFEFLKDLRNLEKLKIKLRRETYASLLKSKECLNNTENIIDMAKNLEEIEDLEDDDVVFRKLYRSNIWSLLQKLKSVCIMIVSDAQSEGEVHLKRIYTRREFNELYL